MVNIFVLIAIWRTDPAAQSPKALLKVLLQIFVNLLLDLTGEKGITLVVLTMLNDNPVCLVEQSTLNTSHIFLHFGMLIILRYTNYIDTVLGNPAQLFADRKMVFP